MANVKALLMHQRQGLTSKAQPLATRASGLIRHSCLVISHSNELYSWYPRGKTRCYFAAGTSKAALVGLKVTKSTWEALEITECFCSFRSFLQGWSAR